jgi:hypothetical protein
MVFMNNGGTYSAAEPQYGHSITLYGTGGSSTLIGASPDGGNFLGLDGDFEASAVTQTISGLTVGDQYTVSFYWGGTQQVGYQGPTVDNLTVGFGGSSQVVGPLDVASQTFSGWESESLVFTADNSSDVLSFLAVGTPVGVPPFVVLDGVSVSGYVPSPTPEPGTFPLLLTGLLTGAGALRMKMRSAKVSR